jgi:FKBP-type peptidyl-prolyl cis-trans isomerase 2
MEKIVQPGSNVTIHYVCKLEDGTSVEESKDEGLKFTVGQRVVVKGLDDGILGMQIGEHRVIQVPAQDAYGHQQEDLICEIPMKNLPKDINPTKGSEHVMSTQHKKQVHMTILEVLENSVIVDMNHKMAGKNLVFEVVVMNIE